MPSAPAARTRPALAATPLGPAEQAAWDALSDDERLAIFNAMLESPESNTYVEDTMADILAAAKAGLTAGRG